MLSSQRFGSPLLSGAALNLVSGLLPALAFIVSTPYVLSLRGVDYFGVYALLAAFMTVVAMLDFGVSRAISLTTFDPQINPEGDYWRPFRTGLRFMVWISASLLVAGLLLEAVVLSVWPQPADFSIAIALSIVAGALTTLSLAHRSVLEIRGRFAVLNVIRSLTACAVPLAPLLPTPWPGYALSSAVAFVLLTRAVGLAGYVVATREDRQPVALGHDERDWSRNFLRRAGKVGVTNAISLLMTYSDRFLVAAVASVSMVAHYVIAYDSVTKVWLATSALMSASINRVAEAIFLRRQWADFSSPAVLRHTKALIVGATVVPCVLIMLMLDPLFQLWLGSGAATEITWMAAILLFGVGLNSMSQLNFSLLQLAGGEGQGVYLQFFNLIMWLALAFLLIPLYGGLGAAAAVTVRLVLDAMIVRRLTTSMTSPRLGFSAAELGGGAFALGLAFIAFYSLDGR